MGKYAWTWTIKPECIDEYVKMHKDPWPDVMEEHKKAGISNYSIFQNGNQFFYEFECEDPAYAFAYMNDSEACQRWNAITSKMVEGSFDFSQDVPVDYLPEVFFLK